MDSKQISYQRSIFANLFVGYGIYAYNRKCVTYIMPYLIKDGFTHSDAGFIASSQNAAYMIGKLGSGFLSDKINSKYLFCLGLLLSGLSSLCFSNSNTVSAFAFCWFLNGMVQGAGWPAVAKLIRKWYDRANFSFYWSVLAASSNVTLALTPYWTSMILERYDWRTSIVFSSFICIIFSIFSFFTLVNDPKTVGIENYAEDAPPVKKNKSTKKQPVSNVSFSHLIRLPFVLIISFSYFLVFLAKTVTGDWASFYLQQEVKFSAFQASSFVGTMETGGFFGSVLIGLLADYVSKSANNGIMFQNRKYLLATCFTLLCSLAAYSITIPELFYEGMNLFIFHIIAFISGFCLYAPIQLFGVLASESAPDHLSGSLHAFVAAFASLGAIVSGWPALKLVSMYSFRTLFVCLAQLLFLCSILMYSMKLLSPKPTNQTKKND